VVRIGITCSETAAGDGSLHPDVAPYVAAVAAAGGEPILLPPGSDLEARLPELGGVIFSGGVDVDPVRYGGRREHARSQADRYRADRDELEIALARIVRERRIPALCICRGVQVVNVAFGGTLIEDVREEMGPAYRIHHRQTYENGLDRADYAPDHEVALDPASRVAQIVGTTSIHTNSMHHQALRDVAEGLKVAGRTSDGVIEAFDATFEHPYFVGVQWHPEELADDYNRRLFSELVRAAERSNRG
jgi:putative glutamine amidotransferase